MSYRTIAVWIWWMTVWVPLLGLLAGFRSFWALLWIVPGVLLRISPWVGALERLLVSRFGSRDPKDVHSYAVELALHGGRNWMQPIFDLLTETYPDLNRDRLHELDSYARQTVHEATVKMAECRAKRVTREVVAEGFRKAHPELHKGTVLSVLAFGYQAAR